MASDRSPSLHKPRLQFVNSTNPKQLRTQQFRKLVKQHAMLDAQSRRREAVQANIAKRRAQHKDYAAIAEEIRLRMQSSYDDEGRGWTLDAELLAPPLSQYSGRSSVDPFRTLPQFSNELIDAERLQYLTLSFMPSLQKSQQYVSTMTSSPIVFLADAHPGMVLQDALDDKPHGGVMTMAAKSEIYTLLNKRLRSTNPAVQLAPDVIAGIFNLILLENSYGVLDVVKAHLKGLRQMMDIIAGSRKAGFDPNLATISVYQGLETAAYYEIDAEPIYLQLSAKVQTNILEASPNSAVSWESPINNNQFVKTALSERSNSSTLWILRSMRELTTMFLDSKSAGKGMLTNDREALRIYQTLLRMPSSSAPYVATTGDNVYECIRLTALIWSTAILHHVSFSEALTIATRYSNTSIALTYALIQSLKRSNTVDCWGTAMIGSFMWVAKTACAAFPTGSVSFKWVYLENARATVYGLRNRLYVDILEGTETLLKVQERLRRQSGEDKADEKENLPQEELPYSSKPADET